MLQHISVLLEETLQLFKESGGSLFLDCTFGGGGHTRALLGMGEGVHVVSVDCDPQAKERSEKVKSDFPERFKFYDLNFRDIDQVEENEFDGVLFDFGLSSFQLDQEDRGFSFRNEAKLDMRLNPRVGVSAEEFLEKADEQELIKAVREYGEEPKWRRVVHAILEARGQGILSSTVKLADMVKQAVGVSRHSKIHPATRTFQGVRIAINKELDSIERALPIAFNKLKKGGLLVAISFHSLEDRIVKRFFNRMSGRPEHRLDSSVQDERQKLGSLVTRKPIVPSVEEIAMNPRSRSAKLRVIRKEVA